MGSVGSVLKLAGRAAVWRTTPEPRPVGFASLLGFIVVLAALRVALQFLTAGPHGAFNPYGINALIAWLALEIVAAALIVPAAARVTALTAMVALLVFAEFILGAISAASSLAFPATAAAGGVGSLSTDRHPRGRIRVVDRHHGRGDPQRCANVTP